MSYFYARIPRSARRTTPTACGHRNTGIATQVASFLGAIETRLWYDKETGKDMFEVKQTQWLGRGDYKILATGEVGVATHKGE